MTLAELLGNIDEYADELTIYASNQQEWNEHSHVVVALEPVEGSAPINVAGFSYLIEVRLAKDVIRVWSNWTSGTVPTSKQACDAVIHYAINDAYLPVSQQPDCSDD